MLTCETVKRIPLRRRSQWPSVSRLKRQPGKDCGEDPTVLTQTEQARDNFKVILALFSKINKDRRTRMDDLRDNEVLHNFLKVEGLDNLIPDYHNTLQYLRVVITRLGTHDVASYDSQQSFGIYIAS